MNILQQMEDTAAALVVTQFEQQMEVFNQLVEAIDQEALPIAQARMLDEIKNMQAGRYGIKVDLSPSSPTRRIAKRIELQALTETLAASGQAPLSRKTIIDSWDIDNKEEAIAGAL